MTLRALWTYDHIANSAVVPVTFLAAYTPNNAYNQLTGNAGTPIIRSGSAANAINPSNQAYLPGYLSWTNSTSTAQGFAVALADIPLLQSGATQAWFGFRTNSTVIPTPGTASVVGVGTSVTAAPTALLTETQLARTVNIQQYVEVFLDIGNNVYSVYVDGILTVNAQPLVTGFTYIIFGSLAALTNSGVMGIRDCYFLDVDTVSPKGRLGPIQSQLAAMSAATAPNYASSDSKTALVDLTTAYSGAPTALPTVTNAPSNDPLTLSFGSTIPTSSNILAMQYKMAAQVVSTVKVAVQLNNGAGAVLPTPYTFNDTTMDYGRDLAGIQLTDPSGNKWTAAGIAATQVILTPQALT